MKVLKHFFIIGLLIIHCFCLLAQKKVAKDVAMKSDMHTHATLDIVNVSTYGEGLKDIKTGLPPDRVVHVQLNWEKNFDLCPVKSVSFTVKFEALTEKELIEAWFLILPGSIGCSDGVTVEDLGDGIYHINVLIPTGYCDNLSKSKGYGHCKVTATKQIASTIVEDNQNTISNQSSTRSTSLGMLSEESYTVSIIPHPNQTNGAATYSTNQEQENFFLIKGDQHYFYH